MKKLYVLFIFAYFFCSNSLKAQQLSIDSLFTVIHNAPSFEIKYDAIVTANYQVFNYYREQNNIDSISQILLQILQVARNNNDTAKVANILHMKGIIFSVDAKHDSSIYYLNESLKIYTSLKDQQAVAQCYFRLYVSYLSLNHFNTAVNYIFKSIEIHTQFQDTVQLRISYSQLGRMYLDRKREPKKAIEYSLKTLSSDSINNGIPYSFLTELYLQLQKPDSAFYYLQRAKPILKSDLLFHSPYYFRALANYYQYLGKLDSASFYFLKAIDGLEKARQGHNSAQCYSHLGEIASLKNNFSLAEKYFKMAEDGAIKYKRPFLLPEIYFGLSTLYGKNHKPEQAYNMFVNYKSAIDSLRKIDATDFLISTDLQYQFSVKEDQMKEEKLKKEFEMQSMINQKKQTRIYTISGITAIVLFGTYGFYDFRKRKKLENQQALADERLRISRDLHDDMGASLSSISVFSSAVKQKLINNETMEAEQLLERMSTDAQEMVSGMSEMVWTISPHNDTIEKLTDRLQLYASGMLSAKNISFSLQCDEELINKKLPVDMRKNIFLILKEAINNAAKYSDATDVKLTITLKEKQFVAVLADNGKGFDISALETKNGSAGNGLRNMRQRADEIHSNLRVNSEISNGTRIEITFNI